MLSTYDLPAVRHFTEDLSDRRNRCDNGEGTICSTLQGSIQQYVQLCAELRAAINQWAQAIFRGQIEFESTSEELLKAEGRHLLNRAKQVAALGRAMNWQCFELEGLNSLHYYIADFSYLLENWVSPRLSVSPAPRVRLPGATEQQGVECLEKLSPLPSDWRPTDPRQLAVFQKQRTV